MVPARRYFADVRALERLDEGGVQPVHLIVDAELPEFIAAPAEEVPVRCDGEGVEGAAGNIDNAVIELDLHGRGCDAHTANSQLPAEVLAPGSDHVPLAQGNGVLVPRINLYGLGLEFFVDGGDHLADIASLPRRLVIIFQLGRDIRGPAVILSEEIPALTPCPELNLGDLAILVGQHPVDPDDLAHGERLPAHRLDHLQLLVDEFVHGLWDGLEGDGADPELAVFTSAPHE
mmetsp:Transcript_35086/g.59421  ORF Transcript_35086/g.59421 Transcript_35086/m.59421 type:complete len:232 (-) Transcript_35086:961-1656(-)